MSEPINTTLYAFAQQMRSEYRAMIPTTGQPDLVSNVETFSIELPCGYNLPARLYTPNSCNDKERLPIVLFVHGGGWVSGDLDTHDVLARGLSNGVHALVLAIEYRLAPEHPAPRGIEDVYGALQWLDDNAEQIGADKHRLVISGDSAGGNIAAVVSMLAKKRKGPKICAQWLMYPAVNFDVSTPSFKQYGNTYFPTKEVMKQVTACYIPTGMDVNSPLLSVFHDNLHEMPPTLISVGSYDPLSDGCKHYAQALQHAGVPAKVSVFAKQQHGFIQFYKDTENNPGGQPALNEGIEFLRHYL